MSLDESKGVWECRYFVEGDVPKLTRERMERLLGPADGPFADEDVYVVGTSLDANVKLRLRTQTLKVKTCVERAGDGFERWVTTADWPLPASSDAWDEALRRLGVDPQPGELSRIVEAGADIADLCRFDSALTCVPTSKQRIFYSGEGARVELAEVAALDRQFTSISFEAEQLERARELREAGSAGHLGQPEGYLSLVSRLRGPAARSDPAAGEGPRNLF